MRGGVMGQVSDGGCWSGGRLRGVSRLAVGFLAVGRGRVGQNEGAREARRIRSGPTERGEGREGSRWFPGDSVQVRLEGRCGIEMAKGQLLEGEGGMSRYSFQAGGQEIIVGWDNPLSTFFVQVWGEAKDEDAPVFWVGTKPEEVPLVEALTEGVRPYGEIPDEILTGLRADFAAREPLTDWQRKMRGSVVKS